MKLSCLPAQRLRVSVFTAVLQYLQRVANVGISVFSPRRVWPIGTGYHKLNLRSTEYGRVKTHAQHLHTKDMQNNEENGSGGEAGMPQTQLAWMAFVGSDEEEGEPDARTQNAQPVEVDIPPTYLWGVVSAQLQAWQ